MLVESQKRLQKFLPAILESYCPSVFTAWNLMDSILKQGFNLMTEFTLCMTHTAFIGATVAVIYEKSEKSTQNILPACPTHTEPFS